MWASRVFGAFHNVGDDRTSGGPDGDNKPSESEVSGCGSPTTVSNRRNKSNAYRDAKWSKCHSVRRWGEDPTKMTVLLAYLSWCTATSDRYVKELNTYKHRFEKCT